MMRADHVDDLFVEQDDLAAEMVDREAGGDAHARLILDGVDVEPAGDPKL